MRIILQLRYVKFIQSLAGCFCLNLVFSCVVEAEDALMDWEAQVYGGEYYEDKRIGAYGIASKAFLNDFAITGEMLYERYDDYNFSGVGGRLTWEATESAQFGLVGSHSVGEYDFGSDFEDSKSEDTSNTLGVETELNRGPITLAAQLAKVLNNNFNNDRYYLSSDLFYWGAEYSWYGRGAVRRTRSYKEYTIEMSRTFFTDAFPINLYVGATKNDLGTKEELRTYHTSYDSVYTGSYVEFLATRSSRWNLWLEASRQDEDMVFSIELNAAFGPGVDAPYISAFGFTP